MELLVNVHMVTYNHEKYIAQAIESVLTQKTSFTFNLIIGEDHSNDNTLAICKSYAEKYPQKIKLIARDTNYGMIKNFADLFSYCTGKYIALCEGDDYWTDEHKLQKQVDFLEIHLDYAICFHNANVIFEDHTKPDNLFNSPYQKEDSIIEDLCAKDFISTASCVFRNNLFKELPAWYYKSPAGDWPLHLFNAEHGKIKYLNEVMSVYRKHSGGIWSQIDRILMLKNTIKVTQLCNKHFNNKYKRYFYKSIIYLYAELMHLYAAKKSYWNTAWYSIILLTIFKYNKFVITRKDIIKTNLLLWFQFK